MTKQTADYLFSILCAILFYVLGRVNWFDINTTYYNSLLIILLVINLIVIFLFHRLPNKGSSGILMYLGVAGITLIAFLSWLTIYVTKTPTAITTAQALFFLVTYLGFKMALLRPLIRK